MSPPPARVACLHGPLLPPPTRGALTEFRQIVLIDAKPSVRKQILRELQIMHDCHSEYIISFYGAFLSDPNICICMEFMDKGSLDGIYKQIGPIDIEVVAKVARAVLEGLTYLYDAHRIIHRGAYVGSSFRGSVIDRVSRFSRSDIKPSNILCNSKGQIKICDFGVSGELINSIADTFVGTSTYMSVRAIAMVLDDFDVTEVGTCFVARTDTGRTVHSQVGCVVSRDLPHRACSWAIPVLRVCVR